MALLTTLPTRATRAASHVLAKSRAALAAGALLAAAALGAAGSDWPEYRGGPAGDGISREQVNLAWPADGPKVLWKVPTTNGFSSFSVGGGKAFTIEGRELKGAAREVLVARDAATGHELWAADVDVAKYAGGGDSGTSDNKGGDGPRSTPTYSDGRVYVLTSDLALDCFDAATGKEVWSHDLVAEHGGKVVSWKNAASPVIEEDLVFVACGGKGQSLLAINKADGKVVWQADDDAITHATPVVATIGDVRQVIFYTQKGLVSLATKDGASLWRFPYTYKVSTASSPVVAGDIVYCSAGYGVGGGACKITKQGNTFTATKMYQVPGDATIANHWSTPVYRDGYLYGMFSFKKYGSGPMKCVELATGNVAWEQPNFGAGQVILVGDKVLALTDDGQLVVVDLSPAGYKEVARAKVVSGKCWSTPALSDGKVYVRSTKEGACVDLSGK